MSQPILLADFLLVKTQKIRDRLYAYELDIEPVERQKVGRSISYPTQKYFAQKGQHWTWSQSQLISNTSKTPQELNHLCQHLWQAHSDTCRSLRSLKRLENWEPTLQSYADYACRVLKTLGGKALKETLAQHNVHLRDVDVERNYDLRAWVIQEYPALSITIESHALLKSGFAQITRKLDDPHDLVNTWVLVEPLGFKDKITKIVGQMKDHRQRLMAVSKSPQMQQHLPTVPDETLIVQLGGRYDYPLTCLQPSLSMDAMNRFGLDLPEVVKHFRLAPHIRRRIFDDLARSVNRAEPDWVTSAIHPQFFTSAQVLNCPTDIRFGRGHQAAHTPKSLINNLRQYGVYQKAHNYTQNPTLKIGLIDIRRNRQGHGFSDKIVKLLRTMDFNPQFLPTERLEIEQVSQASLEAVVDRVQAQSPDIILCLLAPKRPGDPSTYRRLKRLTVGRDIPSQMIYEPTLTKKYAENNIVMGMLAKTGNALFTLAEPLDFADFVVGLDVARDRKHNLPGSINTTAIARVYTNGGQLFGYHLCDDTLEGETLPRRVLENLFPQQHFAQKRVVIHRDGPFRGQEKQILHEIAASLGATFHCVEIRKSGAPRLYRFDQGSVKKPEKGDILKLSETQALLVSSLPPFGNATPQPLHIRCEEKLGIDRAIASVIALTLLHLGSVAQPRLPVSIHYSDKIGGLALKGIKPKQLDGTIPFWL